MITSILTTILPTVIFTTIIPTIIPTIIMTTIIIVKDLAESLVKISRSCCLAAFVRLEARDPWGLCRNKIGNIGVIRDYIWVI